MGRRSSGKTIAAIFLAFRQQREWTQATLAREVGVSVPALRARLLELQSEGMPLEDEREANQVYWSVPNTWFPGGVALTQTETVDLLHELWRLPRTSTRTRLIQRLLAGLPNAASLETAADAVLTPPLPDDEAAALRALEDALLARTVLRIKYYSAHSGDWGTRLVSVHRVLPGPPARFVATCHRADQLKWFRVDGIATFSPEPEQPFRHADANHVNDFVATSADGFHEGAEAADHAFFVRNPEAHWVKRNLIAPMSAEPAAAGIRVTARTAGALRVARFVVSLGDAARPETEPLRSIVLDLAQGAARNASQTSRPKTLSDADVNNRAAASNQATK